MLCGYSERRRRRDPCSPPPPSRFQVCRSSQLLSPPTLRRRDTKPLMTEAGNRPRSSSRDVPLGDDANDGVNVFFAKAFANNPEFFKQATKFAACFCGLQASYLTWGYMQELIMTTQFTPTERVPSGKFPSAAFCVFSNRFLAVIVAAIAVRIKHGSIFSNNTAPLWAFTPCALSNTMSSWSQYAR